MSDCDLSRQENTRGVRHRAEVAVSQALTTEPRELRVPEPRAVNDQGGFEGRGCRDVPSDGLARVQSSRGKCHGTGVA